MRAADFAGAIVDVDDTILDNFCFPPNNDNLHEGSRLVAVRDVGAEYGIDALTNITAEDNHGAFHRSPIHGLEGAVWQLLVEQGVVASELPFDEAHPLLVAIVERKDEIHAPLLHEHGREVPGALDFLTRVASLPAVGGRLAVASSARRSEINMFFAANGFDELFTPERIFSKDDTERRKPDPEAFDRAFASLDLPDYMRGRVAAFEDDPRGIASAREAGLFVCAITTRHSREKLEPLADITFDSYDEAAELIELY